MFSYVTWWEENILTLKSFREKSTPLTNGNTPVLAILVQTNFHYFAFSFLKIWNSQSGLENMENFHARYWKK